MEKNKRNMDFWDQPYYRITKSLSCFMGMWPYQTTRELCLQRSIIFFLFIIQIIPEILAVCHYDVSFDVIMDSVGTFIMDTGFLINTFTYLWNFKKMRSLLDTVKKNWNIFPKNEGQEVMHEYANDGQRLATLYAVLICGSGLFFTTEPLQWKLLNYLFNADFEVPLFCTPMEYPAIDVHKWYYGLLFIQEISVGIVISMVVVYDLLFFLYSQHACGLFAALGFAIEHLPVTKRSHDKGFEYVKRCIQIHNRALKFTSVLEEIAVWNFFLMLGLNMIIMSLTGVQVVTSMNDASIGRLLKNCVFVVSQIVHLFITCFMCQRIMDHSLDLQVKIANCRWCYSTLKTQRLIKLMIMRSQAPCQLTAGKIIIMSLETFTVIMKTSASYFTVFLAMQ